MLFGGPCLEDKVPQSVADTIALVRALEVVLHMVELDPFVVSSAYLEVMGSVVSQIIPEVPGHKPGKYGGKPLGYSQEFYNNEIIESVE